MTGDILSVIIGDMTVIIGDMTGNNRRYQHESKLNCKMHRNKSNKDV